MSQANDYTGLGFNGFLERSIDNLPQTNLDSQGPQTTAIRYDSAQVSGFLGDTLQIGKIYLNGSQGNIVANDGQNNFLLIGDDGNGSGN